MDDGYVQESRENVVTDHERSQSPEAPMNLVMRFETASGPRTVIACSVPRHIAADISDVLRAAGQHAEFIDRYSPLSVSDRLLIREIQQVPRHRTEAFENDWLAEDRKGAQSRAIRSRERLA